MLRHIHVETTLFSPSDNTEEAEKDLVWWLEALTQRNQDYLKQRPQTPSLYTSGVVYSAPQQYQECPEVTVLRQALGRNANNHKVAAVLDLVQEVLGGEHFCDIGVILERGNIDCDGISCWRAAELRQSGIQARPFMIKRQRMDGGTTYHALVLWPPFANVPYETTEDPSLLLGMGGEARAADRAEEIRKNKERIELIQKYGVQPLSGRVDQLAGLLSRLAPATPEAPIEFARDTAEVDRILRGGR